MVRQLGAISRYDDGRRAWEERDICHRERKNLTAVLDVKIHRQPETFGQIPANALEPAHALGEFRQALSLESGARWVIEPPDHSMAPNPFGLVGTRPLSGNDRPAP